MVTETTESFATYTTSTMPGLFENGAYEDPGINVTSRCLPDAAKRNFSIFSSFMTLLFMKTTYMQVTPITSSSTWPNTTS